MLDSYLLYIQEIQDPQRLDLTNIKRVKYLDKFNSLGLPKNKCIILSGGVLALYGIRTEMHDLDLVVAPDVFNKLKKDKRFTENEYPGSDAKYYTAYKKIIEVWDIIYIINITYREAFKQVIIVGGYKFVNLKLTLIIKESLIKTKKRPKDFRDIKLIKDFCRKNRFKL